MAASSSGTSSATEHTGGVRQFSGEAECGKEYKRWKLWISNKLLTLDKLASEARGPYLFTLLTGKALEAVEHVPPEEYQVKDGEKKLLEILDRRFRTRTPQMNWLRCSMISST